MVRARRRLHQTLLVFFGYGSIARPLADQLLKSGAQGFTLIDPKTYGELSTASQCEANEVGRLKVMVGAERLRAAGASVHPLPHDLYTVPDGHIARGAIAIASVDNRRADIGANRAAARMRARLLKINIEPALGTVSIRAYDFRTSKRVCVECQFSDSHYLQQRHPQSCDGSPDGRRTNSPRWLSEAAGSLGALAILQILAGRDLAAQWYDHEWQFDPQQQLGQSSWLTGKPDCRWDHGRRWKNVFRLSAGPRAMRLSELVKGASEADTRLQFCQQVALRGRCTSCGHEVPLIRWMGALEEQLAECADCGGAVRAVPFWTTSQLRLADASSVLDAPLSSWGVPPRAIIAVLAGGRTTSFVIGDDGEGIENEADAGGGL
jgi:hypothetical protein